MPNETPSCADHRRDVLKKISERQHEASRDARGLDELMRALSEVKMDPIGWQTLALALDGEILGPRF